MLVRIRDHQDKASWNEFSRLYLPLIERYAEFQGVPREEATDIAQEVLLQLMRVQNQFEFRSKSGSFRSWLKTVTRNKVIDWFRRRRMMNLSSLDIQHEPASASDSFDNCCGCDERKRIVISALTEVRKAVCEKTWKCFEEHLLKQRRASDVAEELGTSVNSVYVNCTRVINRLRSRCRACQNELVDAC